MIVIGWCDTYCNSYSRAVFTEERKRALIERIRKRRYNFNFNDYQFLPYCCPMYDDNAVCVLNKKQFDDVMDEAWKDIPRSSRLIPMDVINDKPENDILFEKQKFREQFINKQKAEA